MSRGPAKLPVPRWLLDDAALREHGATKLRAALLEHGCDVRATARTLGVSERSLSAWASTLLGADWRATIHGDEGA